MIAGGLIDTMWRSLVSVMPIDLGGTVVLVEVAEEPISLGDGVSQGGLEDADRTVERLADFGGSVRSTCEALHRAMLESTAAIKPDSMELTFGLKLGGEAGIPFVSKGTVEANFTVTLAWDFTAQAAQAPADPSPHPPDSHGRR